MQNYEQCLRLFREGHPMESILSGWNLTEREICDHLLAAHRQGERIDPSWVIPKKLRALALEVIQTRDDLPPTKVSSLFKGRISPEIVMMLRVIMGTGMVESRAFSELTYEKPVQADFDEAAKELLIVAPEIKGHWFRRYKDPIRRITKAEGTVAFFTPHVADMLIDEINAMGVIVIERATNANLLIIDRTIVWEGSGNFLQATEVEEHFRRSVSRLWCDELVDLHDLFI